ncbi:hypothetical protein [Thalassospira xiamenensis]|nr:hypothetical protein [Thalassospira xiamenensis]
MAAPQGCRLDRVCHSPIAGALGTAVWIPAFAGMTVGDGRAWSVP